MSKQTVTSLIGRGIDSYLAERLAKEHHSLSSLKMLTIEELVRIGLTPNQAQILHHESRPPIPAEDLFQVLHDSARTCCVCRDGSRSVIVHHIEPWATSRSHSPANLVALCLEHHDKAHSHNDLTSNLDASEIRRHKTAWEKAVRLREADALMLPRDPCMLGAIWDYFNPPRLIEQVQSLGANVSRFSGYRRLCDSGVISEFGVPLSLGESTESHCVNRYGHVHRGSSRDAVVFFEDALRFLLRSSRWVDCTEMWNKFDLQSGLRPGTVYSCTAAHYFRIKNRRMMTGVGQYRLGYRQANKVRLEFGFDAWETTSSSSHGCHLTGRWHCTSIGVIRSIQQISGTLQIAATPLAIGTGFTSHERTMPIIASIRQAEEDGDDESSGHEETA